MALTMVIYMKLLRYIRHVHKRAQINFSLRRLKDDLKMIRRIVIINIIPLVLGFPYMIFALMSFFRSPPKYHFRIAFASIDISFVVMIIILFQFNDSLKNSIKQRVIRRINAIAPTVV